IDFNRFYNVVIVWNTPIDMGSATITLPGTSRQVVAVQADNASPQTGIMHEMGHGYTLDHSFGDTTGEYGNPWDIMSALNVFAYPDTWGPDGCPANYDTHKYSVDPCEAGPSLNAWSRYLLGWLTGDHVYTWKGAMAAGGDVTETIDLLPV